MFATVRQLCPANPLLADRSLLEGKIKPPDPPGGAEEDPPISTSMEQEEQREVQESATKAARAGLPRLTEKQRRIAFYGGWAVVVFFMLVRFVDLRADFPAESDFRFVRDGVLYTDEGWYANNAIALMRTGEWYVPADMNFAVNLPVMQLIHLFFFAIFGVCIEAVRLTSVFSFIGIVALTCLLIRKYESSWTALLAGIILSTNFFFFAYSRLALAENTMTMFLLGSLYLATFSNHARWGYLFAALSGLCFMLAFYTKTSAAPGFPILMAALLLVNRRDRSMFIKPVVAGAVAAFIFGLYQMTIARWYREDIEFFHSINIGMNITFNLYDASITFVNILGRLVHVDKVINFYYKYGVALLFLFLPGFRRSPLAVLALIYALGYVAALSLYSNVQPRYWVALSPVLAIFASVGLRALWEARFRHVFFFFMLWGTAIMFSFGILQQTFLVGWYFANRKHTFAEAASDMKRRMDEVNPPNNVLLGHNSTTFALFEDFRPINDLYGPGPLEERLELYRPHFLVTEDEVDPHRYHYLAHLWRNPADKVERFRILNEYYDLELLSIYDMLENYRDFQIHFYRLHPKPGPGWYDGEARDE